MPTPDAAAEAAAPAAEAAATEAAAPAPEAGAAAAGERQRVGGVGEQRREPCRSRR